MKTTGQEREEANRLVALGRRRATSLYSEKGKEFPKAFMLSDREVYFSMLRGTSESRLGWLRDHLTSDTVDMTINDALIQYRVDTSSYNKRLFMPDNLSEAKLHNHVGHPDWTINTTIPGAAEFATLVPVYLHSMSKLAAYRRWVPALEKEGCLEGTSKRRTQSGNLSSSPGPCPRNLVCCLHQPFVLLNQPVTMKYMGSIGQDLSAPTSRMTAYRRSYSKVPCLMAHSCCRKWNQA